MSLLKTYASRPKDVPAARLEEYCAEIRAFLLAHISRNGGHLASNLGVVELTVALHRVLDTSADRLVFDVGHQSYVHKLLTGRGGDFAGFRSLGGMSGFTKPSESAHDAFVSGHASTSVSVALGMARARSLQGEDYRVAAVLGDGALTGGLSYEGLCDAGESGEALVVVLNDNEMSIARNVGAVSRQLMRLRLKPSYYSAKRAYHTVLDTVPGGKQVDRALSRAKDMLREAVVPGSFFEQLGFIYLGPANGHDIGQMEFLLRQAFSMGRPVLIHAATVKGKGYVHAERRPALYHGVGGFEVSTGRTEQSPLTFSGVFGQTLTEIAGADKRVCAITAAMRDGTGLREFSQRFPNRFFDVGIAEGHAVTMAAGMAMQGMRPVVAVYSTFLQRAYDQLLHDVGILGLPVVLAVDRAELVGEDGETHQGVYDTQFLSSVPGLEIWSPASFAELRETLAKALAPAGPGRQPAPAAIRYPRGPEGEYRGCHLGVTRLLEGADATVVTYGIAVNTALEAARNLQARGVQAGVVKITRLKPLETEEILALLQGRVYLLEENAGFLCRHLPGTALNTGDRYVPHGTREELRRYCGLDAQGVADRIFDDCQA